MEMPDHADYHVWLHFWNLPPYAKKHLNILPAFLLMPTTGFEPKLPAQQASALSSIHYTIASWQDVGKVYSALITLFHPLCRMAALTKPSVLVT